MTNSKREYNEFIRANLPLGIEYDSTRYQYVIFNGKRFVTYLEAKWYLDYITKFGDDVQGQALRSLLFSDNEPGVWFEANDSTTLFTDTAGTTPVTAPGDAIALQLDKSQGLTLGPELVTNGTFDTDSDWTKGTGWTISGGVATKTAGTGSDLGQVFSPNMEAGKTYAVTFTVSGMTAGGVRPRFTVAVLVDGDTVTSNGTYTQYLTAAVSNHQFNIFGDLNFNGSIDNISVRELPGNHRTQATTAARPLYALQPVGGVRNLLQYTEEFDNAVWDKASGVTATANATTAPDGSETADLVSPGRINQTGNITGVANQTVTASIWVKGSTGVTTVVFRIDRVGSAQGNEETYAISDSAWTRITKTATLDGGTAAPVIRVDVQGTGSFLWGAQLEEGSTATNYQRVGSFLDVSEEGKARRGRLWYNGTSHFMQTGTITPGTDKVQVFAGVRKLSDASAIGVEHSTNVNLNDGSFHLAYIEAATTNQFSSKGTIVRTAKPVSGASAPTTKIFTGLGDIFGDSAILRIDGVQEVIATDDQGTGNYLAHPLYFGARAGTSLFYNGYEDTSIIRFGPNLDAGTISKVESYVASKTPEETI